LPNRNQNGSVQSAAKSAPRQGFFRDLKFKPLFLQKKQAILLEQRLHFEK
jgi:hypothetical protein